MRKLLIALMMLLLVSCTWQREPLSRVEKCSWTGQTDSKRVEYPLGNKLKLVEFSETRVLSCDSIVTYKNVRQNAITHEKLDCPISEKKCIQQSEEKIGSRMAYDTPKITRYVVSDNPNIKVEKNLIKYFANGTLVANADLDYTAPVTNPPQLDSFLKNVRCVNSDGSLVKYVNNVNECFN